MRFTPLLFLAVLGCSSPPKAPTAAESSFSTEYPAAVWPSLEAALKAEGFEPTLLLTSRQTTNGSGGSDDGIRDESVTIFRISRDGLTPPLSTAQASAVMKRLRADFRKAANAIPDGEFLDSTEDEAYQERTLTATYKAGKVAGSARFKWTPWTQNGELVNRLEVVFREWSP